MKLRNWKVTYTAWRETWGGEEQNDGDRTRIVKAKTRKGAISMVNKKEFVGNFSHSIWGTNWNAEEMIP